MYIPMTINLFLQVVTMIQIDEVEEEVQEAQIAELQVAEDDEGVEIVGKKLTFSIWQERQCMSIVFFVIFS